MTSRVLGTPYRSSPVTFAHRERFGSASRHRPIACGRKALFPETSIGRIFWDY